MFPLKVYSGRVVLLIDNGLCVFSIPVISYVSYLGVPVIIFVVVKLGLWNASVRDDRFLLGFDNRLRFYLFPAFGYGFVFGFR